MVCPRMGVPRGEADSSWMVALGEVEVGVAGTLAGELRSGKLYP